MSAPIDPDILALTEAHERLLARGLRMREQDMHDPANASRALAMVEDHDTPQFERYADGSRAEPPFTPAQVYALTEPRLRLVTHEEEAYRTALAGVHEELGRLDKARCTGFTKSGDDCRAYALTYHPDPDLAPDAPRHCHNHASEYVRLYAAEMRVLEEAALKAALREIGQEVPGA